MADTPATAQIDITWLTKFIQSQLEKFQPQYFERLGVDELVVSKKLIVADRADFPASKMRFVGTTGTPAFANAWVNYGAPYSNAGFVKLVDGWVELLGVIKTGTVGSAAFTLPSGLRPSATKSLLTLSNGTTGRVDIGSDGTVTPISPSSNLSVVLDGLRFKAA